MNIGRNKSEDDRPIFDIGTVAQMLGVSVQTLRLYERHGLILVRKSSGNQRRYSEVDIERLRSIRETITRSKISIEGIRKIQSLIPCWEFIRCPADQKLACPAYAEHTAGCWTYRHRENVCARADCRGCSVYQRSSDCGEIKVLIHHRPDSAFEPMASRKKES
jgi:MerR family transcriptional regulator/heat shock protein HspR